MRIIAWIICSFIINYLLITIIVDICLMGKLSLQHAPRVSEEKIVIKEKNRIDIQTGFQCSAYAAAYILRHYGIPADGKELYPIMPNKMKAGYVYPKGLQCLLKSYGFEATYCRGNFNHLKYEISQGNPVIVMILVQKNKNWLHYVPVVGYDEKYMLDKIEQAPVDKGEKELAVQCLSIVENEINETEVLCHMDYHFLNVMYEEDEVRIIDWTNAKNGKAIWDYARTYVIFYEYAAGMKTKYLKEVLRREGYSKELFMTRQNQRKKVSFESVEKLQISLFH